jgi:hypothetical protein
MGAMNGGWVQYSVSAVSAVVAVGAEPGILHITKIKKGIIHQ